MKNVFSSLFGFRGLLRFENNLQNLNKSCKNSSFSSHKTFNGIVQKYMRQLKMIPVLEHY